MIGNNGNGRKVPPPPSIAAKAASCADTAGVPPPPGVSTATLGGNVRPPLPTAPVPLPATPPVAQPQLDELEEIPLEDVVEEKPARDYSSLKSILGPALGGVVIGGAAIGGIVYAFMANSGEKKAETAPAPTVTAPVPVPAPTASATPAPKEAQCSEPRSFSAGEQRIANFLKVSTKIQFCDGAAESPNTAGQGTVLRFDTKNRVDDFTTAPRSQFEDFLLAVSTEYAEANGSKPCDNPNSVYNLSGKRGTDASMCIEQRAHAITDYLQYFMTANAQTSPSDTRSVVYQGNAAKLKDAFGQGAIELDRIGRDELKIDGERQAIKKGKTPIHTGPRNK